MAGSVEGAASIGQMPEAARTEPYQQIICGIIERCVDPISGDVSKWAQRFLNILKPQMEISITGIRWWCLGSLPEGLGKITGIGTQYNKDDMSDMARGNIICAMSEDEKDRFVDVGGKPDWNRLEVFVNGPGSRLPNSIVELEDKTSLLQIMLCGFVRKPPAETQPEMPVPEKFAWDYERLKAERVKIAEMIEKEMNPDPIMDMNRSLEIIDNLLEIKDLAIESRALEIMTQEDPVEYMMDVYKRLHVSDKFLGKIMFLSIANQSAKSTDGIQPKLTGLSGKGKTHSAKSVYHLIPDVGYKITGSLSAKTLFYHPNLMPGTIILSDDVKMSDDLDSTLKQIMSNFQEPTIHRTVIKQLYGELTIPPRIALWMTSVNTDFSDELINRLYDQNVDESPETDDAVTKQRTERAVTAEEAFPVDEEVKICRAIIHMVKCKLFKVKIPYAREIVWKGSSNRRNYNRFLDLVQGFAILRFMQRREESPGVILASIKDFKDAKDLYDATSETQITKLTKAERKLAGWLASKGAKTINEVVKEYLKEDGSKYTYTAIHKHFKGNKGRGGLLDKVPGLLKMDKEGEEAYLLTKLEEIAVGSIVSLNPEAEWSYS
jgi:hypothetical protein